jgi:hypothetical protein
MLQLRVTTCLNPTLHLDVLRKCSLRGYDGLSMCLGCRHYECRQSFNREVYRNERLEGGEKRIKMDMGERAWIVTYQLLR